MIELINNSLEILCRLSKSNAGYLLKLNYQEKEVITSYGEIKNFVEQINDLLFSLFVAGNLNNADPKFLLPIKNIKSEFKINSFLVEELIPFKEEENAFYLIILSDKKTSFSTQKRSLLKPLIEILAEQLKTYAVEFSEEETGSERVNHNYILKHSHGFFKVLLEVSEDLIFILDRKGCFVTLNDFGAASLEYSGEELIGKHFFEFVSFKEKKNISKSFQRMIEHDKIVTFETTLISKYGNEIIFEISGNSIMENGEITGILAVGKNITELRTFEEKINQLNSRLLEANRIISIERQRSKRQKAILYELNKMKSEFVSNISHELRTPLASIIGFSETISSDPEMPVEMKNEFNEIILTEGKRLAKLINDVLDVSRIESGELELNKSDCDIVSIIKEVIENNQKNIEEKNLNLTIDLPQENVILNIDKERISQILNNLVNNAIKFSHNNGRVTISAQELYKEFEITISDTGVGIPEKDLPNLFQKFYKVSRPGIETPGTGLGLVFVKQIVDLHKGFITIQSAVNKGTSVILKLPKLSKNNK